MKLLIVFFVSLVTSSAFAGDFATGQFICERKNNPQMKWSFDISEVQVANATLPYVELKKAYPDGKIETFRGIASVAQAESATSINVVQGNFSLSVVDITFMKDGSVKAGNEAFVCHR